MPINAGGGMGGRAKTFLLGHSLTDLELILEREFNGIPKYRANQIYDLIYKLRKNKLIQSKHLPKALCEKLSESYEIVNPLYKIIKQSHSIDGTIKVLYEFQPNIRVESVLIPDIYRRTLCVSSQVGCSLSCTFCHTGTQKFLRNLTTEEIMSQYWNFPSSSNSFNHQPITNIVFMGQGEPLYNWKSVSNAVKLLTDPRGIGIGHGRIVISTSGIAPLIPKIASELKVMLAISLHAPNDDLRSEIMSINKNYPIYTLMEACREFVKLSPSATRRITFEYVMLKGINDNSNTHAKDLINLIKDIPCHVNLIPFNSWPGSPYETSKRESILAFQKTLQDGNIEATIRESRGSDIMAACGQLRHDQLLLSCENNEKK